MLRRSMITMSLSPCALVGSSCPLLAKKSWPTALGGAAVSVLDCASRLGRTMMGPAQGTQQHEKEHEEKQEHMLVHEESSEYEMRRRTVFFLEGRIRSIERESQAARREVRIIHHQQRQYRHI